ncbi:MAG: FAD-dependent oxidoreductase [Deltaproteobacteria bacterium]|jgi:dimethylamine/trimethylamine dehydrogenase|nr:FAD-dependent oxidoreductase [Deltaproteobacteria bacterium]
MARDPRYDILFEPVPIGPVTAPNRFYQVPHCTGMGHRSPQTLAAMREVKAEGGWGVVCTEYCSIHASSDDDPYPFASLWDEEDVRAQALMVDKVHRHGALAGVELWHSGPSSSNLHSREESLGPWSRPAILNNPTQCRVMDKRDIRELRRWHAAAARRAQRAGFDIVYVYGCHSYLISQFLSPANRRSDEYGGSLENRLRLFVELVEETKAAVGDSCAVAVRYSAGGGTVDGEPVIEEHHAMIESMAGLPDLWDLVVDDYSYEMGASRFVKEAALEDYVSWVKRVTDKPVVTIGRFTSPDTMLRQLKDGIVDLIGSARPSIADPFLPKKIDEGRLEDIRECIGCNICFASDAQGVPIRCTQNPSMGEEWRRGWHPERIPERQSEKRVLVVGGGPAGLEAATALGRRGYEVTLAEASKALGGRVALESNLPGLAEWARVRDWRVEQLNKLPNVEIFLDSRLDAEQILEFAADCVALATGARWRSDGLGRWYASPIEISDRARVLTPDDIMAGVQPEGPVVIFDDDHYYMGGVIAEKLRASGLDVTLATTDGIVSSWTRLTDEQIRIQTRLLELGVRIETSSALEAVRDDSAVLACAYTGARREIAAGCAVMVTSRTPCDSLYHALCEQIEIQRVGDCSAPGTIAAAVFAGHRYARDLDGEPADLPFRREGSMR